jgi:hypothetical protein
MSPLNPAKYSRVPRFGVRRGLALAVALGAAVPEGAPEVVRAAARTVADKVLRLQHDWRVQQNTKPVRARAVDTRVDTAWRAAYDTLKGVRSLATTPRGQRAQHFFGLLFPDGMVFTKLPFREQWAECERRLERLRDAAVAEEFNTVMGGPECLQELRAAHEAYGFALDITNAAQPATGVADALAQLKDAIAGYTVQVLAWSRTSVESERLARQALLPIDLLRASARIKLKAGEERAES